MEAASSELVPSEIEKLPIPVIGSIDLEALDAKIRGGINADVLLKEQDGAILGAAGLTKRERTILHEAWQRIRDGRQVTRVEVDVVNWNFTKLQNDPKRVIEENR